MALTLGRRQFPIEGGDDAPAWLFGRMAWGRVNQPGNSSVSQSLPCFIRRDVFPVIVRFNTRDLQHIRIVPQAVAFGARLSKQTSLDERQVGFFLANCVFNLLGKPSK
ncbi:hypothetical protein AX761_19440 [Rhizobium sp. 58]|nr:hypothetical protein AX761_19440 [Rhizobium sp. 58]